MVQSAALSVDEYFGGIAADRLDAMRRLREECCVRLTGWEERMQWGMPGYGPPGGDALISFNSQKGYISLYIGKATIDDYKPLVKGASFGKGCIRYTDPDRIDFDLLATMLSASFRAKGGVA